MKKLIVLNYFNDNKIRTTIRSKIENETTIRSENKLDTGCSDSIPRTSGTNVSSSMTTTTVL